MHRLSHVRPGGLHLSEEAVKRSDYEIEHRPHGTVVWYSEPDGTLRHETFIFYSDAEIHRMMAER
jgi:hypothetical protein